MAKRPVRGDRTVRAQRERSDGRRSGPRAAIGILLSVLSLGVLMPAGVSEEFILAMGTAALVSAGCALLGAVIAGGRRPAIGVYFVCGAVILTVARAVYADAMGTVPVLIGLAGQLVAIVMAVLLRRR